MADLPFVDTHIHLWDLGRPDLHYSWLQPGVLHPILGDI
jgi:predicted TIM-barrel fold metal-dependent hydrolase